jgi:hypothetical protein
MNKNIFYRFSKNLVIDIKEVLMLLVVQKQLFLCFNKKMLPLVEQEKLAGNYLIEKFN